MDRELPLHEYLNQIRGCLAFLKMEFSANSKEVISNYLNTLLTCYRVDDYYATLYVDTLLEAIDG